MSDDLDDAAPSAYRPVPLTTYARMSEEEMRQRASAFNALLQRRRTVRFFSSEPVPRSVLEDCMRAAGSARRGRTCSRGSSLSSAIPR